MNSDPSQQLGRDERLGEVLAAWIEADERGQAPERGDWLACHPELAAELAEFLANRERLRNEARSLCAALGRMTSTRRLEDTAPSPESLDEPAPPGADRSLGEYDLLDELGQGGMGLVYRARHRGLHRLVALKLLRPKATAAADVQRFRAEAEVLAQLDHPHIVPIYDVGPQHSQLYFSMKLIDGSSLAEPLDQFVAQPRRAAQLLAVVARAVHHAHQRGILHRDLKPANVLLDHEGQPHVTDFGLARRLEGDSDLTQSGALVGTPSYMAPEQTRGLKGALTTATDVYGLGAVLYAALTGKPPFRGETVLETLEQVRECEPQAPRRGNPRVDRDLETICLKCLQKDPARRYGSAEAVAEDLERWLAGEPIRARRLGTGERLRKWVRRRPALAALAAVTALALVGLVTGLLWHDTQMQGAAHREHEAAEREHQHAEDARAQRDLAREQRQFAREAVNDMYTDVAEKWLARQPRLEPVQRQFLEKALRYYQHIVEEDADPSLRYEMARAYYRLGAIQAKLGKHVQAQASCRKALTLFGELLDEAPDKEAYLRDLSKSYHILGGTLQRTGQLEQAAQAYRESIAWHRKQLARFPGQTEYQALLGDAQQNLAFALAEAGKLGEAEQSYHEAETTLRQVLKVSPGKPNYRSSLAILQSNLAQVYFLTSRIKEAELLCREAIRAFQKLVEEEPAEPEYRERLAYLFSNLTNTLQGPERAGERRALLLQAIAHQQRLVADYPTVPDYAWQLAASQINLGATQRALGDHAEAEKSYRQALAAYRGLATHFSDVPEYRINQAKTEENLGNVLGESLGRPGEAEEAYQRAALVWQGLSRDFPRRSVYTQGLANNYRLLALHWMGHSIRLSEAEEMLGKALKIQEQLLESDPRNVGYRKAVLETSSTLAWLLVGLQGPPCPGASRAIALTHKALELRPEAGDVWYLLGLAHYRAGSWKKSLEAMEKSRQLGFVHRSHGWFFAMVHWRLGDKKKAREWYRTAEKELAQAGSRDRNQLRFRAEAAALLGIPEPRSGPKEEAPEKK